MNEFNGESLQVELDTDDDDANKINESIQRIKRFFKWLNKKFNCCFLKQNKKKTNNGQNGNNSSLVDFKSNEPQYSTVNSYLL